MHAKLLIAGLALVAAGCGSSGQEEKAPARKVQSEGQKTLHKLDETSRAIALKRAIHSSGYQCVRIDRSEYVQDYRMLEMWAASCNDGRGWALFVGRDDTVQVRSCKDLADLKLPRCPKWAEEAKVTR